MTSTQMQSLGLTCQSPDLDGYDVSINDKVVGEIAGTDNIWTACLVGKGSNLRTDAGNLFFSGAAEAVRAIRKATE